MLWLSLSVAAGYFLVVRDPAQFTDRLENLTSPGEMIGAVLSPFSFVVATIVMRIIVTFAALAAAYPLTRANRPSDYRHTNSVGRLLRTWLDRWKLCQSYRALRWTWAVRSVVLDRLDAWRSIWHRWDLITLWANIVLFVVFFVVLFITTSQLPE